MPRRAVQDPGEKTNCEELISEGSCAVGYIGSLEMLLPPPTTSGGSRQAPSQEPPQEPRPSSLFDARCPGATPF